MQKRVHAQFESIWMTTIIQKRKIYIYKIKKRQIEYVRGILRSIIVFACVHDASGDARNAHTQRVRQREALFIHLVRQIHSKTSQQMISCVNNG